VDLTALIGSNYGDGKKLRSTSRFCPTDQFEGCPYENAFWDGAQMVYGEGFAVADDVVAHEMTHGVTDATSGLFYWHQSGAINESMSDVFSELVDLADSTSGVDDPADRWLLGEDLSGGAGRDMEEPTAFEQPDRVGGTYWDLDLSYEDSGGVHTNSGVGNKAAFLITDGGTFNGRTVAGIGEAKTANVYWEANKRLTPAADYADLAAALQQGCQELAATAAAGFTTTDCDSVTAAVEATQMTAVGGPSTPAGLTVKGAYRQAVIEWAPPTSWGTGHPDTRHLLLTVSPPVGGFDAIAIEPTDNRQGVMTGLTPGRTYTFGLLAVTDRGTSPVRSRTVRGTRISAALPTTLTYGASARVSGTLSEVSGVRAPGRTVRLYRKRAGERSWRLVASKVTSSAGTYSFSVRPSRTSSYFVQFSSGSTVLMGSRSVIRTVGVRPAITKSVNDSTIRRGVSFTVKGRVTPRMDGQVVKLQRYYSGGWHTVKRATLTRYDATRSRYAMTYRPGVRGTLKFRVFKPAGAYHLRNYVRFSVTVR
ncbi:MAG: M4 family metallopeptidase, partial [Actinomycetes bacterium]